MLLAKLHQRLFVGAGAVLGEGLVLGHDDLLSAVGEELRGQGLHPAAQQHGNDGVLAAELLLQVVGFGQQLKSRRGEPAALLLSKHPDVLIRFFSHVAASPHIRRSASRVSTMALAISSTEPV